MNLWWHKTRRELVFIDGKNRPWRITAAGPVASRVPEPFFTMSPIPNGFVIGIGPLQRPMRATKASEFPYEPEWRSLDPIGTVRVLFGKSRATVGGFTLLQMLKHAGGMWKKIRETMGEVTRVLDTV